MGTLKKLLGDCLLLMSYILQVQNEIHSFMKHELPMQ